MLEMKVPYKPPEGFEIIPHVTISEGLAMAPEGDDHRPLKLDDQEATAEELVKGLFEYVENVYIDDLQGLSGKAPDFKLYKKLEDYGYCWVHSHFSSDDDLIDLLMNGAEFVVVGKKDVDDPEIVSSALEVTPNIAYRFDMKDCSEKEIQFKRKKAKKLIDQDVFDFVLTQHVKRLEADGPCAEMVEVLKSLDEDVNVFLMARGGSVPFKHLDKVVEAGFAGAVTDLFETVEMMDIQL